MMANDETEQIDVGNLLVPHDQGRMEQSVVQ